MKFNKKIRVWVTILCLLLIFTTLISFIDIKIENNENTLSPRVSDDQYETWWTFSNNNEMANATDLSGGWEDFWLNSLELGNQSDDDWYRINTSPGKNIKVMLNHNYSLGMMDVELWNNVSSLIGNYSAIDNKTLDFYAVVGGDYYIMVSGNNQSKLYDLWWNATFAGPPPDDNYEPNNNLGYDPQYTLTNYKGKWLHEINGMGIQADDDWYTILVPIEVEQIIIVLENLNPANGYVNMGLYNTTQQIGWSFNIGGNTKKIDVIIPNWGGYYFIKVFGDDNSTSYDLKWNSIRSDDNYDTPYSNDFPWETYYSDITSLRNSEIYLVQKDDDWYEFSLDPFKDRIFVELHFDHLLGDMQLELYNWSNDQLITGSYSADNHEYIDAYVGYSASTRLYKIKVYGSNTSNNYRMRWSDIGFMDDIYEPNNDYLTAYDISDIEHRIGGTNESHAGVQWDEDWFRIDVNQGEEQIHVELHFPHTLRFLNIEILFWNAVNFTKLDWRYTLYDSAFIDLNVPWNGTYYIKVFGSNMGNHYYLRWESSAPYDDSYEENDFDWEAYYLLPFAAQWLPFGRGIQQDDDWYQVYLDPGEERIYVEVSFSHLLGDIDLEVYYWDGGIFTLLGGSYSFNDYESIDMIAPWSGFYYIKVYGANWSNSYDLWWEDLNPAGGGGVDDGFEDNDDFYNASWINPNYYPDLRIVDNDEDWFSLYLNSGDNIEVYIYFDHYEGDLELELYDPNNNNRIGSYSVDNEEKITFTADISGDWRIRVFHASGDSRVHYSLDIWVNGGGDDQYEENDLSDDAYDLTSHESWWLSMIMGDGRQFDIDWYKFDIGDGVNELIVELNYDDWEGDINIELIDSLGSIIGQSNGRNGHEFIEIRNPASGTYFIRIYGDDYGNWYDLYWSSSGEVFYGDDFYEYNDEMYEAYGLWDDEQTWLSDIGGFGIQGNVDWYMIDVTPHFRRVVVELEFNHSQGDINLALYNFNHNLLAENTTDNNEISLNVTVGDWGAFFIQITGDNAHNEYDLWWDDIRTNFEEDAYEQNDNYINATDLIDREYDELQYYHGFGVQYDQDWFEIIVTDQLILNVEMFYDSAEGLLGFEVYDDSLKKVTGNFTLEDNDFVSYRLRSNGTHYIKVFGDNTGNVYNLIWNTKEYIPIEEIPGYDILILLGSIFGVASIVIIKWKRSKFNRK